MAFVRSIFSSSNYFNFYLAENNITSDEEEVLDSESSGSEKAPKITSKSKKRRAKNALKQTRPKKRQATQPPKQSTEQASFENYIYGMY